MVDDKSVTTPPIGENNPENTDRYGEHRDDKGRFTEGNPGKPEGAVSLTAWIKSELKKIPPGNKMSWLEALGQAILKKAILDGDVASQKMIWNYIDGMPKESRDITSGGKPIPILGGITNLDVHTDNSSQQATTTEEENKSG